MVFRTKIDYSDNRQIKQRERTFTTLSGGTTVGVPFSALTSGIDFSSSGITFSDDLITSTFSGNSGTTIVTWGDSRMAFGEGGLSAITPSNSGVTQNIGAYAVVSSTIIDGNTVDLLYTGVTYDVSVDTMTDFGGSYTGTLTTDDFTIFSADSLDYKGRAIWMDNPEITRTKKLIVTENPNPGYVLTSDSEGMATWQSVSAVTSGATFWEEDGTGNTALKDDKGGHTINGVSDNSIIVGGSSNSIDSSTRASIVGGVNNNINSGSGSLIAGASSSDILSGNTSIILGGNGHNIQSRGGEFNIDGGGIIGGATNDIIDNYNDSDRSFIVGGVNNNINDSKDSLIFASTLSNITNSTSGTNDTIAFIIGGSSHLADSAQYSGILGGNGNVLNDVNRSVILGGQNITATTDDTVYVYNLNIGNVGTGTSINTLGVDASGNVVVGSGVTGETATIDPYYGAGSSTAVTWNVSAQSTNYEITITADTTVNLTNVRDGEYGTLWVEQGNNSGNTITFGTINGVSGTHIVVNGGGGSPTLTTGTGSIDILTFTYNGNSNKMAWSVGNDYT